MRKSARTHSGLSDHDRLASLPLETQAADEIALTIQNHLPGGRFGVQPGGLRHQAVGEGKHGLRQGKGLVLNPLPSLRTRNQADHGRLHTRQHLQNGLLKTAQQGQFVALLGQMHD